MCVFVLYEIYARIKLEGVLSIGNDARGEASQIHEEK